MPEARSDNLRRRKGLAYLLVMAMLSAAVIVSYAALASSVLETRVVANELAVSESESAARSAVDLSRHFLAFPHESPAPLVAGDAGDVHFPGLENFSLSPDTSFSVDVTNPDIATYDATVTGTSNSPTGEIIDRQATVRLIGLGDWSPLALAQFRGNVSFRSLVRIRGSIVTDGNFLGGGDVEGSISAANYGSHSGWSAPPALPIRTMPDFDALNLVRAAKSTGYYLYGGNRCRMQRITDSTLTSQPTASVQNPGRVFYYDGTDPLKLDLSETFNGTLVITRAELHVFDNQEIQPMATLPALLAGGRVFVASGGRLRNYGLTYLDDGIWTASTTFLLILVFDGDELLPPGLYNGHLRAEASQVLVEPLGSPQDIPDLTDQGIEYDSVQIESWSELN